MYVAAWTAMKLVVWLVCLWGCVRCVRNRLDRSGFVALTADRRRMLCQADCRDRIAMGQELS